jgi:hypothetical protein
MNQTICYLVQLASKQMQGERAPFSVLHGRPWGFFGPPVPLAVENRTRSRGRGKLKGTGAGPLRLPVFPRALRVTGF